MKVEGTAEKGPARISVNAEEQMVEKEDSRESGLCSGPVIVLGKLFTVLLRLPAMLFVGNVRKWGRHKR